MLSILKQRDSWDHLRVPLDSMKRLLDSYRICSQFLDYLQAFGFKVKGEDENFHGFDSMNTLSGTRGIDSDLIFAPTEYLNDHTCFA